MRNFTKILCVVLALIVALSAASCSLSKEYSYETDDVELPIGVYIYYLYQAYNEAQNYAKYVDGYTAGESFLDLEITDNDGNTAVCSDWIKDKAAEYMDEAVAIYHEFEERGCTVDEAAIAQNKKTLKDYWDNGYQDYAYMSDGSVYKDENGQPYVQNYDPLSKSYEPYYIGFDSFYLARLWIPAMRSSLFTALYGTDGSEAVTDEDLHKYYEENYTSYHYFYASISSDASDEDVKKLTDSFTEYASEVTAGATVSNVLTKYNEAYSASAEEKSGTAKLDIAKTKNQSKDDTALMQAIIDLKEGEAKQVIIGEDSSRKIYLIYKEPIADTTETEFESSDNRESVLSTMKEDDFRALLKKTASEISVKKSSACDKYKPSMFES